MAFDDFPRTQVEFTDGNLRIASVPGSPRVLLLGITDNTTHDVNDPIRIAGSTNIQAFDLADGTPSELSKAIQECRDGGADNIEVMIISNDITPSVDERFSYLGDAYDLLIDHDIDIVVPVGARIDSILSSDNNFAYQLANFCYQASINFNSVIGVLGTEEINSGSVSLTQLNTWVTAITGATSASGFDTTSVNGTDFTIYDGVTDAGENGVPDRYAFYATTDEAIPTGSPPSADGQVIKDRNNQPVDIGKYISVVAGQYRFTNPLARRVDAVNKYYDNDGAAAYAGLISQLPSQSAPTNKPIAGPTIIRNFSVAQANALSNRRFVVFRQGRSGVAVVSAMTGAFRISDNYKSDFHRLTSVRIANEVAERCRDAANPFLGEGNSGIARQALRTELEQVLAKTIENGAVQRYEINLISTPAMQTLGEIVIEVTIVPAFEITDITIRVSQAAA